MAKIIKKIGRVILIVAAVCILVPVIAFLLLQSPKTQTLTVNKLAGSISQKTGIEISVGKVNYSFFKKIVLDNLLIKDQNKDTLLAVRRVNLRIRDIKTSQNRYSFGRVELTEPDFRMITDTSGVMNLTLLINTLRGSGGPDTANTFKISFSGIGIVNGSCSMIRKGDTVGIQPGIVNFRAMKLSSVNGMVRDLNIDRDSVYMGLRDLAFIEAGGFKSLSANMDLTVADGSLFFRGISLLTDSSSIIAEKIFLIPTDTAGWSDFINRVRFDMVFDNSILDLSDLAYFVRPLATMDQTVHVAGRLSGRVAELKGRKLTLRYGVGTHLAFDFDISGLPALSESYMYINFRDMTTSAADIGRFTLPGKKPVILPEIIRGLGNISYKGNFTGFITDFVSFGTLATERGSFSTDLSLRPDARNMTSFNGFLKASDIDLAYFTRNKEMFGGLWFHADVEGSMQSFRHITANINGMVDSVEINDYKYRNVALKGTYSDNIWDGSVKMRDKNVSMDLLGRFDLAKQIPEFDFTLNLAEADLHRINLVKDDSLFRASALITASFSGNRVDNLNGDLRMINAILENSNGKINIYDFLVSSALSNGVPLLTVKSDFLDAEIKGNWSVDGIRRNIKAIIAGLFPSRYSMPEPAPRGNRAASANFTLNARMKKIDRLNEFFGTGLSIADGSRLNGTFSSDRAEFETDFSSGAVSYAGARFGKLKMESTAGQGEMELSITSDTLLLPDRSILNNFQLQAYAGSDTIDLGLIWNNNNNGKSLGEVRAKGFFSINELNKPALIVGLQPSAVNVNFTPWKISPAHIVIDSTSAYFDNILVSSKTNYIRLDGRMSRDPKDKLTLSFEGLNLAYLNKLMHDDKPGSPSQMTEMNFGGIMKGSITLSDIYDELLFESNMNVSDFVVNNNKYGLVSVKSEWDPRQKLAMIDISNDYKGTKYFDIRGSYNPSSKYADITLSAYSMPLDILNPFVSSFASDLKGAGSGKVRVQRKIKDLVLTGSVMAQDASMKIDYLQTRYNFSDSIRFTPRGIEFRNIRFFDEKKNQGRINGILSHRSFKDVGINFDINMDRMQVLNTRPKDNDIFYGTAYATGYAGIRGTPEKIIFNISAKTNENTVFYVPLNTSESVNEYPYIVFVDHRKKEEKVTEKESTFTKSDAANKMELNFDLEVTPVAEVQLIMDKTSGDVIKGRGSGKLNMSMKDDGQFKMSGVYTIETGDYLFTLGNIMNKKFIVEEGGTITWNGPLDDAEINLKAIYKTKASLYDILPETWLSERIPVECDLILSEKLLNPIVKFDITLPTADDKAREILKAVINTEEELSRQFLYLLVMNSFYPDPQFTNQDSKNRTTAETQGAAAIGVTTIEMLSNQLSNWLSQISNDFDIGFNYRPTNEVTQQEVEVALSTQLLNDKVILNGNVDVGGNQSRTRASNITGEFTIEFKITEQLRFKVFNRSNNDLFYEMPSPYTQGFGIFYRRDFDKLKDLFTVPENRKKKKAPAETTRQ